jgi:hypothetical protein
MVEEWPVTRTIMVHALTTHGTYCFTIPLLLLQSNKMYSEVWYGRTSNLPAPRSRKFCAICPTGITLQVHPHVGCVFSFFFWLSSKHCDHDTVLDDGRSVTDHLPSPTFLWEIHEQPRNKQISGKPNSFLNQKVFSVTMKVQSYLLVGLKRTMEISGRIASMLRFKSRTSRIIQNRRINNYTVTRTLTWFIILI